MRPSLESPELLQCRFSIMIRKGIRNHACVESGVMFPSARGCSQASCCRQITLNWPKHYQTRPAKCLYEECLLQSRESSSTFLSSASPWYHGSNSNVSVGNDSFPGLMSPTPERSTVSTTQISPNSIYPCPERWKNSSQSSEGFTILALLGNEGSHDMAGRLVEEGCGYLIQLLPYALWLILMLRSIWAD